MQEESKDLGVDAPRVVEQLLRIHIATHSDKVLLAVANADDDCGGPPCVGKWKRPRSS